MNWQVKSDTSKLPKNLIFPPGKSKGEQQTHTSLGGYNEPPLSLLPSEKIEYWPQLLLSTEAGKEECYSLKLWCTQTGWLYKNNNKKKKKGGSRLLSDQLSCLSWFQSYRHSFTVNLTCHKLAMRPNKPFPLIPSSFFLAFPSFDEA